MKKSLSAERRKELLAILKDRFARNTKRHEKIAWTDVLTKLDADSGKLWSLNKMEETGGEPDIVGYDETTGEYIFYDCAPESPKGRRSICYDHEALDSRKEHRPADSVVGMATDMGIELLTEEQYRYLQTLGAFDTKTSSWVHTPQNIRKLGGAVFCDRRYDTVFLFHNGAESYYAVRGFRGSLKI